MGHARQVLGGDREGSACFLRTGGGFGMVFSRGWWGLTAKGTGGAVSRLQMSGGTLSRPGCHGQTGVQAAHCTGRPGRWQCSRPAGEAGPGLPGERVIFFYFPRTCPLGSGGVALPVVTSGARRTALGEVLTPMGGGQSSGVERADLGRSHCSPPSDLQQVPDPSEPHFPRL